MGKTMTEKILAKASGKKQLSIGDVVVAKVDTFALNDSADRLFKLLDKHNLKVWDPKRIIICFDHFSRQDEPGKPTRLGIVREAAEKYGIPKENIFDLGRHGVSHQVPGEVGWVLPGTLHTNPDTQAATLGALNCISVARGRLMASILATGEMWLRVPECVKITLRGKLPKGVLGKDIYLRLLKDLGEAAVGRVLEFAGPGVDSLPIDVRMGVANGSPHLGALTMIFPPDQTLMDYIKPRARGPYEVVTADPDAEYAATYEYDLAEFEPLVAGPDAPTKIQQLSEVQGTKVQAAYIGSCNAGRLTDLMLAAEVLKGRKVHPDVRLVVTPISSTVMQDAAEKGLLATFAAAGATITTPGCGACFYSNQGPLLLDDGEVCITSSVENWPGRMGSAKAKLYLGNAAVVAASAVEGQIANPEKYYAPAAKATARRR